MVRSVGALKRAMPVPPVRMFSPSSTMLAVVRFTPAAVVVVTSACSVVVPVPAVCTRLAASMVSSASTLTAVSIRMAPSSLPAPKPTVSSKSMLASDSSVSASAEPPEEVSGLVKVMVPPASMSTAAVVRSVGALKRAMPVPPVTMFSPSSTMAAVVRFTPSAAVVVTLSCNVVVPVPAVCTRLAASMVLSASTLTAVSIRMAPSS